ncbi:MAG: thioredoxin domain-containing protein, partial [Myxococcales bacterium]|nr:thioredoxin domain-containing protein [Myxococcales bacterium]
KQTLGDLGEVEPGTLSPAALSALHAVAVGRETGVVETPEGFRILRRMPSGVARGAALAAEAVLRIGGPAKLFALLDKIRDQVDVDARLLERWVRDIGVDATAYAAALADPAVAAKVDGDVARATDLGVVAPGTLFVNGTSAGAARVGERIEGELALASALVTVGEPAGEVSARVTRRRFTASPLVYRVSTEGAPSRGPSDAPVTIVEYGDFQCPYTARAEATLERLRSRYGSSLRFVWRDMPLPFHPRAEPAASLAREARAQKRDPGFWTVHDRLFADARSARSARLEDADLLEVARATGLDTAAVTSALAQKKHRAAVEAEAAAAVGEAGVTGTPQFFVNGRRIVGGVPFEHFRQTIEEELAKAKKLLARGVAPAAVYDELTKDGFVGAERVDVGPPPTDRPFKGGASAKVTLQVFSDFQCPYCRLAEEQALAEVARTYGERVKIVWRHSPLWFHKDAVPAAEAAEEAYAQKGNAGFWAFHDALFAGTGPDALGRATLERYAAELGLDLARFRRALDDHTHRGKLAADAVAAFRAEVGGVPSFTVGAFPIEGAQPFEAFKKLIDAELAAAPR